jgi:7-carboxy-7-deazaguanine synthase
MNDVRGWVAEMFASIQGEGSWLGRRQIFLRLAGCRRRCRYCDTAWARTRRPAAGYYHVPDRSGRPERIANPVPAQALVDRIDAWCWQHGPFHSLALTGGEPLEQASFVADLVAKLRRRRPNLRLLLETNGLEVGGLRKIGKKVDFIAADVKLPSAGNAFLGWSRPAKFLATAGWAEGCVKVVVNDATRPAEVAAAARVAWRQAPTWEFILQPAAANRRTRLRQREHLRQLLGAAVSAHPNVRLIPQMHKVLGMD